MSNQQTKTADDGNSLIDELVQLLGTHLSNDTIGNFDVCFSDVDWDEFDRMLVEMAREQQFDDISDEEMKILLEWCSRIESEERQRILNEYTDHIDGIDIDEFFHDQDQQFQRETYVDDINDIDMEELFSEWWEREWIVKLVK